MHRFLYDSTATSSSSNSTNAVRKAVQFVGIRIDGEDAAATNEDYAK